MSMDTTVVEESKPTNTPVLPIPRAIVIDNLEMRFGGLRALSGISLEVVAGTVFGFLGPNGAGKTTTIRILLGLLIPSSGRATVLGLDPMRDGAAIRARTGVHLEDGGLYHRLTALENLELQARVGCLKGIERASRVRDVLTAIGLWDRRNEQLTGWSRGMKQRLSFVRATLNRPSVLFLDEPTAGLDPAITATVRRDITDLAKKEGTTVFLTTHNLPEAEQICDDVAILLDGSVRAMGSVESLRAARGMLRVDVSGHNFTLDMIARLRSSAQVIGVEQTGTGLRLELATGTDVTPFLSSLAAAGGHIEEVRRNTASLEEVFLRTVGPAE